MQQNHEDVLAALDDSLSAKHSTHAKIPSFFEETHSGDIQIISVEEHLEELSEQQKNSSLEAKTAEKKVQTDISDTLIQSQKKSHFFEKCKNNCIFLTKYLATSLCIFGILMVVANYSAYYNIAYSMMYAEEMEHTKNSLIESVAASDISNGSGKTEQIIEENHGFGNIGDEEIEYTPKQMHDMQSLAAHKNNIELPIEITPYENRIVIPRIGKNIPLLDITQTSVKDHNELNDIFMKELENGVIRYPGSAKPGENGNTFIFGHSSNFPWMKGDYNDVFSLLDNVVFDDEVIVYYGQEKYVYKIRTKNVISPGDVSVLKSNADSSRAQITLMTCWPIGTTLNRLVLTGELIRIEKN